MKVVTKEEISRLRAQQASMPIRLNDELRESVAFKQWLHREALAATDACKARLRGLTGDGR